jgi:hypothetical protein
MPPDVANNAHVYKLPLASGLQLTAARCEALGMSCPRAGWAWSGTLGYYRGDSIWAVEPVSLGVGGSDGPPAVADDPAVLSILIKDPLTGTLVDTVAVTPDAAVDHVYPETATFELPDDLVPGRYALELRIAWPAGATWTHCGGALDVLPELP